MTAAPWFGTTTGWPRLRPAVVLLLLAVAAAFGVVATLGLVPALLVLAVLGTATAVLVIRRFDVLLHLLVLSVFIESVGFGPVRVGRVLAVVAVVTIAARLLLTSWRPQRALRASALLPVVLFWVWVWASGLWSADTSGWSYAMGQLALAAAYFAAFALFVERVEQVRALLRTYVLGAVFASAVAYAQVVSGSHRAEGLQGDPNIYALYQVAALPAAAVLASTAAPGRRWPAYAAMPVIVGSVLATQSRGGLATAVFVLLVLLIRGDLGGWLQRNRKVAVSLGAALCVALVAGATIFSRRFSIERILDDRASGRFDIWYVAFREWQDNWLLGIGGGNFKPRSVELLATEPGVELIKSHLLLSSGIEVHNIYLETLVEYGVVGCLLFLAILVSTAWNLHRAAHGPSRPVLRALPMVLLAFLVGSFFLSVVNNKLLWILIGLAVVLAARPPLPGVAVQTGGSANANLDVATAGLLHPLRTVPRPVLALAAAVVLLSGAVAATVTALRPPTHAATVQFVVTTVAGPAERETIVKTLQSLVAGQVVADDVREESATSLTAGEITDRIVVDRPGGALVFSATYVDRDRARAERLARALVAVFPERVDGLSRPTPDRPVSRYSMLLWGGGRVSTSVVPAPVLRNAALGAAMGSGLVALLVAGHLRRRPGTAGSPPASTFYAEAPERQLAWQPVGV